MNQEYSIAYPTFTTYESIVSERRLVIPAIG